MKKSCLIVFLLIWHKTASSQQENKNEETPLRFQSRLARHRYILARTKIDQFKEKFAQKVGVGTAKIDGPITVLPESRDDGTELWANRHLADQLFESDMLLNVDQIEQISKEYESRRMRRRRKRKVIIGDKYRWPTKTINYKFSWNNRQWQKSVRNGLRLWELNSCLRFRENYEATGDYLNFITYRGCSSHVGRQGGRQGVSIADGCTRVGIVAHEVAHALGYWHEQSRPDRDFYIRVNFAYVLRSRQYNFSPHSAHYTDHPYDYGSVMHYGPKGFTIDWNKRTIDTRDPLYENTIGQRAALSFIDVKQINELYCNDICKTILRCKHGGYPDPNDCYSCKCPDGLAGNCDRVAQSASHCGGELRADNSYQFLRPPRVFANQECYWRITAPQGKRINFKLKSLDTYCQDTCYNYVELKFDKDWRKTGPRFCCKAPKYSIVSALSEMMAIFRTDEFGKSNWNGFELRYRIDGGRPSGTTTRRPTTTTRRPTRLSWGEWTRCSLSCGGCGLRARYRHCSSNSGYSCRRGWEEQRRSCAHRPCITRSSMTIQEKKADGKSSQSDAKLCRASLHAPCRYIDRFPKLIGLTGEESSPIEHIGSLKGKMMFNSWLELDPDDPVAAVGDDVVGKRRPFRIVTSELCARTVYYQCARDYFAFDLPNNGVKQENPLANGAHCCQGYRVSGHGDRCIKTF